MRKIKEKISNKEKSNKRKNNKLQKQCLPLHNTGVMLTLFNEFLKEHRELFDNEECYLEPYLKGILTRTYKKIDFLLKYNFNKEFFKDAIKHAKKSIIEIYDTTVEKVGEEVKKLSKINYEIFKTYACMYIILHAIHENFVKIEKDKIYNSFKNRMTDTLHEFKLYNNFWQKEISEFEVQFF